MTDEEPSPENERMKLCYIDFTTQTTDGINNSSRSSSVRGKNLEECLKFTKLLHGDGK